MDRETPLEVFEQLIGWIKNSLEIYPEINYRFYLASLDVKLDEFRRRFESAYDITLFEEHTVGYQARCKKEKREIVQVRNPKSGHYVKIDRLAGRIVSHKKTIGPYKDVPIAKKRSK